MGYCEKCRSRLEPDSSFCAVCGTPVTAAQTPQDGYQQQGMQQGSYQQQGGYQQQGMPQGGYQKQADYQPQGSYYGQGGMREPGDGNKKKVMLPVLIICGAAAAVLVILLVFLLNNQNNNSAVPSGTASVSGTSDQATQITTVPGAPVTEVPGSAVTSEPAAPVTAEPVTVTPGSSSAPAPAQAEPKQYFTIDLNDYLIFSDEEGGAYREAYGVNAGYFPSFDLDSLSADFGEKLAGNIDMDEAYYAVYQYEGGKNIVPYLTTDSFDDDYTAAAYFFMECVDIQPISYQTAENGDTLWVRWNCSQEKAENEFGCSLVFEDRQYTVRHIPTPSPTPTPTPAASGDTYTTTDTLTLRPGPSLDSGELGKVPNGETVKVLDFGSNGFYHIRWNSQEGYILSSYMKPESGSKTQESKGDRTVNTSAALYGWPRPSTSDILMTIPSGAKVKYFGTSENGTSFVEYQGQKGFVITNVLSDSSSSGSQSSGKMTYYTTDTLTLKQTAQASGAVILATLPPGTAVTVLDFYSSGFYKVSWNGMTGYLVPTYLSPAPGSEVIQRTGTRVTTDEIHLYDISGTNGLVLATIPKGSTVDFYCTADLGMSLVSWNGIMGFVRSDYIR